MKISTNSKRCWLAPLSAVALWFVLSQTALGCGGGPSCYWIPSVHCIATIGDMDPSKTPAR